GRSLDRSGGGAAGGGPRGLHDLGTRRVARGAGPARLPRGDPDRCGSRSVNGPTPAELQVLIAGLSGVAEEVGAVLQRSAFSPTIEERADCSAAVFTPDGQLLAQAEHIPVHLGSMPASVSAVIGAVGDQLGPGDQAIVNDPFAG